MKAEDRRSFELILCGMVLRTDLDRKVIRWCLNTLAHIGQRGTADKYVSMALKAYEGDPEITAAGIAALSKMYGDMVGQQEEFLRFEPTMRTLAAMQYTHPRNLDMSKIKIDIGKADDDVLKLALITVGLNREVENLFHPRHSNGQIVKVLGQHPNSIVVQYSVWAIAENLRLTMSDLGVPLDSFDKLPPNVQSKILQLVVERGEDAFVKHSLVESTPFIRAREPRDGLARTLRSHFYDGLENVTLDWFDQEQDEDICGHLAEHIGRYSNACGPYFDKALEIVEARPKLKNRILLGSEGSPLYRAIREQDVRDGHPELFDNSINGLEERILRMGTDKKPLLKVLFLAASPRNEERLRLDEEARDIKDKLRRVDKPSVTVDITNEWAVRVSDLQDILLGTRYGALQFSGHGGGGTVCFEDSIGDAVPVDGTAFSQLIKLAGSGIECVILNACYSDDVAKNIVSPVQCVIGCDDSIGDDAAIAFSRAFYRGLAHGKTYEESFHLAQNEVELHFGKAIAGKYKFTKV